MNVNFKPENIYYPAQNGFSKSAQKSDKSAQNKKETQSDENLHSEKKSRLEQLRQQKQQEYEQAMQQLQKMREDEQKAEKEGRSDKFTDYGKLLKIAMRIMNGDKVPTSDMKKLAKELPDLYKQAILMRNTSNDNPKKYKKEFKDEKDKTVVERMLDDSEGSDVVSEAVASLDIQA